MAAQNESSKPDPVAHSELAEFEIASGFKMSTACGNLIAALVSAQGNMQNLVAQETGEFQERVFRYADLASILNMSRPHLAQQGLAVLQLPTALGNQVRVTTLVLHGPSAEWLAWELLLPVSDRQPRSIGSVITYARRYMLNGLLNVATEYDDEPHALRSLPHPTDQLPSKTARSWSGPRSRPGPEERGNPRRKQAQEGSSPDLQSHATPESEENQLPTATEVVEILPERMLANLLCQKYLARSIADYNLLITTACDDPLLTWIQVKSRPDLVGRIVHRLERWCDLHGLQPEEVLVRMKMTSKVVAQSAESAAATRSTTDPG